MTVWVNEPQHDYEELGFFLAIDRDRNGNIIRRIERGGPADRAGLRDGDRILAIDGVNAEKWSHEKVVNEILKAKNDFSLTVIDDRSDDARLKNRPFMFRIMKGKSGYGFYMWNDTDGHFVENVTAKSPADKAGLRAGDRILEINGVNIEAENAEDVFYRIKACHNMVTLLAVDAKTFGLIRKNHLSLDKMKAELGFSGYKDWVGKEKLKANKEENKNIEVTYKKAELIVVKDPDVDDEETGWGFHLANQMSFMDADDDGTAKTVGHIVHWVEKGGPADYAGLRDGDKILQIGEVDVSEMNYEDVMVTIKKIEGNEIALTIEYEEVSETSKPREVTINKKPEEELGFILWFDDNGHYIEDVTIGTPAYLAGLRQGDRLLEVNHHNVEQDEHEAVVELVKESGDMVTLNVQSIKQEAAGAGTRELTVEIIKENNTFGFSINQDAQGFFIQMLAPEGPAESAGVSVGDRVIGIDDREDFEYMDFDGIVEIIKSAKSIRLSILTQQNKADGGAKKDVRNLEAKPEDDAIFKTLRGEEKVDYVVQKRFLQQKLEEKAKRGTDMRKKTKINKDLAEAPGGDDDEGGEVKEKKKAKKGISFGVTEVAEIDEDGKVIKMGEMETKKGKRKKKKKKRDVPDGTVATTDIDAATPKKKMTMAEYSKAMRKRTLEKREGVVEKEDAKTEGKKSKSSKSTTKSSSRSGGGGGDTEEKWDWEAAAAEAETKQESDI